MHVFLTGGTGFVGSYVLRALLNAGHTARCLVRTPGASLVERSARVETVLGDVTHPDALTRAVEGCDAIIHLVGILDEQPTRGVTFEAVHVTGTIHAVQAAQNAGIDRFIHMSANGAHPDADTEYLTTKWRAEQVVKDAGFDHWTIFRPSLVFGDPGLDHPEFASKLTRQLVRPFPILPVFGDGSYRMQPIAVEAVTEAFVQALTREAAHGRIFCAAGRDAITYTTVLNRITRALGAPRKPKFFLPLWLARPLVQVLGPIGLVPITPHQLEMLVAGNTCDPSAFFDTFDVQSVPFTPEHLSYLRHS